jgi:hypothetical protein
MQRLAEFRYCSIPGSAGFHAVVDSCSMQLHITAITDKLKTTTTYLPAATNFSTLISLTPLALAGNAGVAGKS